MSVWEAPSDSNSLPHSTIEAVFCNEEEANSTQWFLNSFDHRILSLHGRLLNVLVKFIYFLKLFSF